MTGGGKGYKPTSLLRITILPGHGRRRSLRQVELRAFVPFLFSVGLVVYRSAENVQGIAFLNSQGMKVLSSSERARLGSWDIGVWGMPALGVGRYARRKSEPRQCVYTVVFQSGRRGEKVRIRPPVSLHLRLARSSPPSCLSLPEGAGGRGVVSPP